MSRGFWATKWHFGSTDSITHLNEVEYMGDDIIKHVKSLLPMILSSVYGGELTEK